MPETADISSLATTIVPSAQGAITKASATARTHGPATEQSDRIGRGGTGVHDVEVRRAHDDGRLTDHRLDLEVRYPEIRYPAVVVQIEEPVEAWIAQVGRDQDDPLACLSESDP